MTKNGSVMKPKKKVCVLFVFLFFGIIFPSLSLANNVTVSNVSITQQDNANQRATIEFDISWSNSWRNFINYDAVWVFARYYDSSSTSWKPATHDHASSVHGVGTPTGWSAGTGTPLEFSIDSLVSYGFILQRSAEGNGDVDTDNIQFVWDWGTDHLTASTSTQVKVYAIEMVYVPSISSFYLGDSVGGSVSDYGFRDYLSGGSYLVSSSTEDPVGVGGGGVGDDSMIINGGVIVHFLGVYDGGDLNDLFPTGGAVYSYIMKYEISQGQYAAFLSTLANVPQSNRYPNQNGNYRHTIVCLAGSCTASRPDRACNYLNWMDLCAFCDWAGMRPMTEVEFEVVARGPSDIKSGIYSEYAWGSTVYNYAQTIYCTSGIENGTETISYPENANVNYGGSGFSSGDGGYGPLRSGIFATSLSNRESAGAAYYGVMDLSGNVEEQCVSIGNSAGRAFAGSHGDGTLSSTGVVGIATNSDWPGYAAADSGVSAGTGSGLRGGGWASTSREIATSSRSSAANPSYTRSSSVGGRCSRTNPQAIIIP